VCIDHRWLQLLARVALVHALVVAGLVAGPAFEAGRCPPKEPARSRTLLPGAGTLSSTALASRPRCFTGYGVGTIETLRSVVKGSLHLALIRGVIRQRHAQLDECYDEELEGSSGLCGQVVMQLIISNTGEVQAARILQATLRSPEAERCIVRKIQRWMFPRSKLGGTSVALTLRFGTRS
jgi:hypothetical protein